VSSSDDEKENVKTTANKKSNAQKQLFTETDNIEDDEEDKAKDKRNLKEKEKRTEKESAPSSPKKPLSTKSRANKPQDPSLSPPTSSSKNKRPVDSPSTTNNEMNTKKQKTDSAPAKPISVLKSPNREKPTTTTTTTSSTTNKENINTPPKKPQENTSKKPGNQPLFPTKKFETNDNDLDDIFAYVPLLFLFI
jgi:hypothetical protein